MGVSYWRLSEVSSWEHLFRGPECFRCGFLLASKYFGIRFKNEEGLIPHFDQCVNRISLNLLRRALNLLMLDISYSHSL